MTTRISSALARLLLAGAALASPAAAAQSYALEIGDAGELSLPYDPIMNTDETVTIECWLRSKTEMPPGNFAIFERYKGGAEHKDLAVYQDGKISYTYAGSPWHYWDCAPDAHFPLDAAWHHLAWVRRADDTWEIYVDGASILKAGPAAGFGSCCWLNCGIINSDPPTRVKGGGGWQLRSLRVSDTERYLGSFTPDPTWSSDADTALLLLLDEGAGDQAFDLGPAAQEGTLTGDFTWVSLDCDGDGVSDAEELATGTEADCNGNDVPDSCDITAGLSLDLDANGVPDECVPPPLNTSVFELSVGAGGTQPFELDAGPQSLLNFYLVMGSQSGTSPGIPVDGLVLPLNFDAYFYYTLANPNSSVLSGTFGSLAVDGTASAAFVLPPGTSASLAGISLDHAYAVFDISTKPGSPFVSFVSNPVPLVLEP